jgi:hypothetical protein
MLIIFFKFFENLKKGDPSEYSQRTPFERSEKQCVTQP